jgi:hypothetical protein
MGSKEIPLLRLAAWVRVMTLKFELESNFGN